MQVVASNLAVTAVETIRQPRQQFRKSQRDRKRQRLQHADERANHEVDDVVADLRARLGHEVPSMKPRSSVVQRLLTKLNSAACPVRLVNRTDQGDRPAPFAAIDLRGGAGVDGPHVVGELAGMSLVRDRLRIGSAARGTNLLSEVLLDRIVVRRVRLKLPAQYDLLLDDRRAAVTVDGDRLRQSPEERR